MMTRREYEALNADHPEWVNMTNDEIRARFWMYDIQAVRMARGAVHWRRLLSVLAWPVGWLAGNI